MTSELALYLAQAVDSAPDCLSDAKSPDREYILYLAQRLVKKLEQPRDLIRRIGYEAPSQQLSLRLAVDLRLFHLITHNHGPMSSAELANACGAEELLIVRILRVLTANNFAAEAGAQMYSPTDASYTMTDPAQEAMVRSASDDTVQIFARLPRVLQQRGYRCPTDALDCPLQWTMNTNVKYFDWVTQNPQQAQDLQVSMKVMQANSISEQWFDYYPVKERLLEGWRKNESAISGTLLVDVGGGDGYDLKCLIDRFPEMAENANRLVLQDLPDVIAAIDTETLPAVQKMSASFFDQQPIQGARSYYTHRVLHNWADPQAHFILQNLRDAMCPGYSRLLLNETVLPDTGCSSFHAAGDLNMMGILGGIKRTKRQWMQLLESVGLVLEKIWTSTDVNDLDGILEVTRKN